MAQVFPLNHDMSLGEDAQVSLAATLAALPDPWTLLRDRRIGDADPTIDVVLVHPEIGVALVAMAPTDPSGGVDALAAYLERERFGEFFAGELPIVALSVAPDDVPAIGETLEQAFAEVPPLAIADKDWADAVIELLLTSDDLTMAPAFGRSSPRPEEAAPPLRDFEAFDERFEREPREDLSAPLPLAVDWPFGEERRPRRRGLGIAASVAFLILLGGGGYAAWTYNTEEDQLAEIAPAGSRQIEVPMPPSPSAPEQKPEPARESSSTNSPPPPPAAAAPAHPPVTLAAKPFAPPPPTPPTPSRVAPLPTAIAKAEPPPAAAPQPPAAVQKSPVEQAQSSETPAPTPPPDAPKAIAGNDATRDIPPPKPTPPAATAAPAAAAAIAAAGDPPAPATDAGPPPPPPAKPKPSRIVKSEPPAPKRVAKSAPPSPAPRPETAERAPPRRVANAGPSDHPPFDATDLPPLEGKLTPPEEAEAATPAPRNNGNSGSTEMRDASNAAIGRPTPLFGTQARATVPAETPAQPQMASATTGQRECRPYTSERTLTGRGLPVQGIACRDADGQWRLVSEVPLR